MANIIQFATGQELQTILEASNQMVAGMSPEEARAALKLVESGQLMTGSAKTGGANNVIQFPGANASGAFNDYISGGGTISPSNSATASSTSSATIAQGVTGAGTTSVLGVLTMNLPTVAAAVAPVLGVALGAGLYSANPELWTKISQTLLPFCWDDTDVIPAVVDKDGQVYLDGNIFDSMKQLFSDEEVGKLVTYADNPLLPNGNRFNGSINKFRLKVGKLGLDRINSKYILYPGAQQLASWYNSKGKNIIAVADALIETEILEFDAFYVQATPDIHNRYIYIVSDKSGSTGIGATYMDYPGLGVQGGSGYAYWKSVE